MVTKEFRFSPSVVYNVKCAFQISSKTKVHKRDYALISSKLGKKKSFPESFPTVSHPPCLCLVILYFFFSAGVVRQRHEGIQPVLSLCLFVRWGNSGRMECECSFDDGKGGVSGPGTVEELAWHCLDLCQMLHGRNTYRRHRCTNDCVADCALLCMHTLFARGK